jgi:hypothetical protein
MPDELLNELESGARYEVIGTASFTADEVAGGPIEVSGFLPVFTSYVIEVELPEAQAVMVNQTLGNEIFLRVFDPEGRELTTSIGVLGFESETAGTYQIELSGFAGFDDEFEIVIEADS